VVDHPGAVTWRDDDVVLLAMKSQATQDAIRDLAAAAPSDTAVICAQNGVENERVALRRFANVYGMCVMMPASHLDPGVVDAESLPIVGVLDLGRYPEGLDGAAERIAVDLSASGFRSEADPAVMSWKYEKLLLNLSTGVRAICGPGDEQDAPIRELVGGRLRSEALACYDMAGIILPDPRRRDARWGSALTRRPVAGSTALAGSAWQSLARRTGSSEADYINGEITLLGRVHGVPTPTNDGLARLSNEAARELRSPGSLPITELARQLRLV
jgi:2-dehydropantoate 2-reductase